MADRLRSIILLAATAGCSAATSNPTPQPVVVDAPSPIETPRAVRSRGTWIFQPVVSTRTYTSAGITTLELASDSGPIRETITTQTRFTLTTNRNENSAIVTGSIEELSTNGGTRVGPVPQESTFPLQFTGISSRGHINLELVNQPQTSLQCENPAASVLASVKKLVFVPPMQLLNGATWTDSTSSVSCRGALPVNLTTVQTYKVIGEVDHTTGRVILLERNDRSLSAGEGSQGQHRIAIKGAGTGSGKLYLDPTSGSVLEADIEHKTTLTVTSSGRNQQFIQINREKTTLSN